MKRIKLNFDDNNNIYVYATINIFIQNYVEFLLILVFVVCLRAIYII